MADYFRITGCDTAITEDILHDAASVNRTMKLCVTRYTFLKEKVKPVKIS